MLVALSTTRQPDPAGHGRRRRAGPAHCPTHHQPVRLAGAAGVAADILAQVGAFLAPGQPGGGTGLLWDRTGRPAIQPTPLPRRPHGRAVVIRPREQVDPDGIAAELLAVVEQSDQPVRLSLWLRPPASQRAIGSSSNRRFDDTITFVRRSL